MPGEPYYINHRQTSLACEHDSGACFPPKTIAKEGGLGGVPDILVGRYDHLDNRAARC